MFYVLFRPWLYWDMVHLSSLLPLGRMLKKDIRFLKDFSRNIIKKRMHGFDNSIIENMNKDDNETDVMTRKRLAMLDLLISQKLNGSIDDEGIAEEVDTFIFAVCIF